MQMVTDKLTWRSSDSFLKSDQELDGLEKIIFVITFQTLLNNIAEYESLFAILPLIISSYTFILMFAYSLFSYKIFQYCVWS